MARNERIADAVLDCLPQRGELDAVGHAERKRLTERSRVDEPQLVRDELDRVAGSAFATVDHQTKVLQDRAGAGHVGVATTDEQREAAVACTVDCAGHRRVGDGHTIRGGPSQLMDQRRAIGGQVDPHRARPHRCQCARGAGHDTLDMVGTRQGGEQDIAPRGSVDSACRCLRTRAHCGLERLGGEVEGKYSQPGTGESPTHRTTHVAQPDKANHLIGRGRAVMHLVHERSLCEQRLLRKRMSISWHHDLKS